MRKTHASAEMQSRYSTDPADWAGKYCLNIRIDVNLSQENMDIMKIDNFL